MTNDHLIRRIRFAYMIYLINIQIGKCFIFRGVIDT